MGARMGWRMGLTGGRAWGGGWVAHVPPATPARLSLPFHLFRSTAEPAHSLCGCKSALHDHTKTLLAALRLLALRPPRPFLRGGRQGGLSWCYDCGLMGETITENTRHRVNLQRVRCTPVPSSARRASHSGGLLSPPVAGAPAAIGSSPIALRPLPLCSRAEASLVRAQLPLPGRAGGWPAGS